MTKLKKKTKAKKSNTYICTENSEIQTQAFPCSNNVSTHIRGTPLLQLV